MNSVPI